MIFLVRNKTLLKTGQNHPIYKYEVNADKMRFVIPQYYEDINLEECLPVVQIELPKDDDGNRESRFGYFKYDIEPYKEGYLSITIPIGSTITMHEGIVKVWLMFLKAVNGQTDVAEFILKTNMASFLVEDNDSAEEATESKFDEIWLHTSIDELADAINALAGKVDETVQWEDDEEDNWEDDDENNDNPSDPENPNDDYVEENPEPNEDNNENEPSNEEEFIPEPPTADTDNIEEPSEEIESGETDGSQV